MCNADETEPVALWSPLADHARVQGGKIPARHPLHPPKVASFSLGLSIKEREGYVWSGMWKLCKIVPICEGTLWEGREIPVYVGGYGLVV